MSNGCVALILAGGENSRADSYRNGAPKCILPLGDGRSILNHLVDALLLHDIHPIVLGVEAAQVSGIDLDVLSDPKEPGIIAALTGAAKYLNHRRDTRILVCYGDTFLPWFPYIDACVPGTLTVAGSYPNRGNVAMGVEGARYGRDLASKDWIEAGATCLSPQMLAEVSRFDSWPEYLAFRPWGRVCFHHGRVINVGDRHSYEEAKQWQPRN